MLPTDKCASTKKLWIFGQRAIFPICDPSNNAQSPNPPSPFQLCFVLFSPLGMSAALFISARLGISPTPRDLYNLHAHVHQIDFPTGFTGISSSLVPHSGPLPPEPVPFPAVSSGAEQQSSSTQSKLHPGSGLLLCGSVAAILLLCVANSAESGSWKGTQPPPGALPYTRYPDNPLSMREATIIWCPFVILHPELTTHYLMSLCKTADSVFWVLPHKQ